MNLEAVLDAIKRIQQEHTCDFKERGKGPCEVCDALIDLLAALGEVGEK